MPEYQKAVEEGAGFAWDIAPPPHHADVDAATLQIYGPSFAVFRSTSENQWASWVFARWMSEPAQQARWASETSYFPTRRAAEDVLVDFAESEHYQKALGLASLNHVAEPAVVGYDSCRVAIEQMMTAVLAGGDPQSGLDAAALKCSESLE
jgi:sn-glycerol 3-phosphate transport system substrate-binding protein